MQHLIVIPARIGSTRFPRKPLIDIDGKPMIQRVWEAAQTTHLDTIVATDSQEIVDIVERFSGKAVFTGDCNSGTDRCHLAVQKYDPERKYSTIINLQGDLPFADKDQIMGACRPLNYGHQIGTVVTEMKPEEQQNPNSVKAIVAWDGDIGRAKWFLRAPLSYGYHHLGIYAYERNALARLYNLRQGVHEQIEQLEQLRALENAMGIGVAFVRGSTQEINAPEDLDET